MVFRDMTAKMTVEHVTYLIPRSLDVYNVHRDHTDTSDGGWTRFTRSFGIVELKLASRPILRFAMLLNQLELHLVRLPPFIMIYASSSNDLNTKREGRGIISKSQRQYVFRNLELRLVAELLSVIESQASNVPKENRFIMLKFPFALSRICLLFNISPSSVFSPTSICHLDWKA